MAKFLRRAGLVRDAYRGICRREPTAAEVASGVTRLGRGTPLQALFEELGRIRDAGPESQFVPPGHHYSPVPPRAEVERHLASMDTDPDALPGIALDRAAMVALWRDLAPLMREAPFAFDATPGLRYRYDNGAFSWGDGLILHAMLRHRRPRRLVEVGSGWSSACIVDTNERYLDGACAVTCIEPYPQLLHETVGDAEGRVRIIARGVQDVPLDLFATLSAGDVLFIDSTHVLRTGGDVAYELLEILPRLAPGVLVHVHDMFWPFEYPRYWSVDDNRAWNEIYAIRAMLCDNPRWRIVMFNDFLFRKEAALIAETCPAFLNNPGGSLWLERVG